jgi:hypothetical protein
MKTLKPFSVAVILLFLFFSCHKSSNNPAPVNTNVTISLVSGNNQTAQVGYLLPDSIVVKVTSDGSPVSGYKVQFVGSGCNEDLVSNINTKTDGTAVYYWSMAANSGTQTLRAIAIGGEQRIDSVFISANAVTTAGNAAKSACTPSGGYAESIVKISTGRLLACFSVTASIRYSDDNGISWNPLTGFGANHTVVTMVTTPQDGIFAATTDAGIFYSNDAGNTWTNVSPPGLNKQSYVTSMAYTKTGEIFVSGTATAVFISADKGKTWTAAQSGLLSGPSYGNPVELNNGDLYLLSMSNIMFKSTDGGQTWTELVNDPNVYVTGIYADNNGWLYKAWMLSSATAPVSAIDVSKDNGATFSNIITYAVPTFQPYIQNMSIQSDGNFYFGELSYSICSIPAGGQVFTAAYTDLPFSVYVLAQNDQLVYAKFNGIYY